MRKKSGGPNTDSGKSKVSQNAIKHSLSTSKVVNMSEKNNIDAFAQDLISHYDIKDPLEILQLQRIALYREKLAKAYQAESAQVNLAQQDLQNNPQLVFEKMSFISPVAKGMALEYIRWNEWFLPYDIKPKDLRGYCEEIQGAKLSIQSESEFIKSFPTLAAFLRQLKTISVEKNEPIFKKLEFISTRLKTLFSRGEDYQEKARYLWELLEIFKREQKAKYQQDSAEDDELEQYIRESQEEIKAAKNLKHQYVNTEYEEIQKEEIQKETTSFPSAKLLREQLSSFVNLLKHFEQAQQAYAQFETTRDWMMQTVGMQAGQSDVLLRYQTTWERRLSAAIGELLELQKRSKISK